ncbi:hypothetical protein PTKIN_Ptkin17bG0044500 [Pterospermum kingtungense]
MDNQDQGNNHSSGQDSHVVHLCHKCGWPFPNPHPSAKHRRAHKKICGTIEGYKLVDSHTTASDDEPLSDEDKKTPISQAPKVMESGRPGKSIGGIGAISNRSEGEVFSDAATEFQDSGFGFGRQDSMDYVSKEGMILQKDITPTVSFKDCKDTDILQPQVNSADGIQNENPVLKNMPILLTGTLERRDLGLSYSKDSEDRNDSASDMVPFKTEALMDVSEENGKVSAGDRVAECSVGQENDVNKNEEGKSMKNLSDSLILPSEDAGEISETVSLTDKGPDVTLDMVFTENMTQLKEEFSGNLASKKSMSENGEQETDGAGNSGSNLERNPTDVVASNFEHESVSSEKTEDVTLESGLSDKIVELEENNEKCALNTVINDLSPKFESAKDMDASTATFQVQTDATHGTDSATPINSDEVYGKKEKENESVYVLSVPDDIPVVENSEIKLEGFKDHSRVKLPQLEILASEEIIIEKEDEVRDGVSQGKSDAFQSTQLDEDIKVGTYYVHDAEDSYKLGANNEPMVKQVLAGGETDVIQIIKGSDALGSPVGTGTIENEKDQEVCSLEEQPSVCVSDDLQKTDFSRSMINVLPDVNPVVAHADNETRKLDNEVGTDDREFPERDRNEVLDIAEGDNIRRIDDENYVKNTGVSCESKNDSSLSQTSPVSNLLEVDNSDDIGTKTEKCDITVVESGDGLEVGYFSMKTNSASESISTPHQSPVTEEVNNEYVRTLPELEGLDLTGISNSEDDIKKSEINRDNKVQGECAGEDLMTSALGDSGGNGFERTSEDELKKELMHSPSYAEPTSQTSGVVDDSHARESGVDASGISTVIMQGEADNGSVKPQLDAPLLDVSNETSSQTDSLEGHWGSVSVLSTLSDNPAVIDTETLPSTGSHEASEAEKANIKNSKVASEERHIDKSDEFEPPSFMTLVEPGGNDKKAAAAEIRTAQNAQDPRAAPLQTGWFPSLTHVANESPGRKKNEEIIAKVTNWNTKLHTPLKNLLGEGNSETKPKSPNSKENPAVVIPREEKVAKDNGGLLTKVSSILGPETPETEPTNIEAGKEWDSPARYPADIKREKRKVKSRPLWVQFVCCSSVH